MSAPQPNARQIDRSTGQFDEIFNEAAASAGPERDAQEILDKYGLDIEALERYATGACLVYERDTIETALHKHKSLLQYVIDYVKSKRRS